MHPKYAATALFHVKHKILPSHSQEKVRVRLSDITPIEAEQEKNAEECFIRRRQAYIGQSWQK